MAVARSAPVPTLPAAAPHDPALKPPGQRGFGGEYSRPHGSAAAPPPPAAAARPASLAAASATRGTRATSTLLSAVLGLRPLVRDLLTAPLFTQLAEAAEPLRLPILYDLSSRRAKTAAAAAASGGGTSGPTRPLKEAIAQRCSQLRAAAAGRPRVPRRHDRRAPRGARGVGRRRRRRDHAAARRRRAAAAAAAGGVAADGAQLREAERPPLHARSHEWTPPELLRDVQLDLPPAAGGAAAVPASVDRMLESFFAEEPLEVACESAANMACAPPRLAAARARPPAQALRVRRLRRAQATTPSAAPPSTSASASRGGGRRRRSRRRRCRSRRRRRPPPPAAPH